MEFNLFLAKIDAKLADCEKEVLRQFGIFFRRPDITWDLRGTCAGKAWGNKNLIQLNRQLCEKNLNSFMETVVHEYAHLVVHNLRMGQFCVSREGDWSSHGKMWKKVMWALGYSPERCHKYEGVEKARVVLKPYIYRCSCMSHFFTTSKHYKVQNGTKYKCLKCNTPLVFEKIQLGPAMIGKG